MHGNILIASTLQFDDLSPEGNVDLIIRCSHCMLLRCLNQMPVLYIVSIICTKHKVITPKYGYPQSNEIALG